MCVCVCVCVCDASYTYCTCDVVWIACACGVAALSKTGSYAHYDRSLLRNSRNQLIECSMHMHVIEKSWLDL